MGLALAAGSASAQYGGPYTFGAPATPAQIAAFDIDIMPDGTGLPPGQGTYDQGRTVYTDNCEMCHGENLGGGDRNKYTYDAYTPIGPALIGGRGTLTTLDPVKTVESYWPYSSTLFDYIRRAMPWPAPGSLTDDQVYALTAYILGEANIVDKTAVMNKDTLWQVQMPNRDGFIPDPRPIPAIKFD
jgi:cytochrome c